MSHIGMDQLTGGDNIHLSLSGCQPGDISGSCKAPDKQREGEEWGKSGDIFIQETRFQHLVFIQ